MAAIAAGVKRTFQEMRGNGPEPQLSATSHWPSGARSSLPNANMTSGISSASRSPSIEGRSHRLSRVFEPDASVVLIGVRGVGKSSLAVLAAAAYNRRPIETDRVFSDETGATPMQFRKSQGSAAFLKRHHDIFKQTLEANSKNCVIVCSFSDLESDGARLLQEYASTHPVIHITRDLRGIQSHVRIWSGDKIEELVHASKAMLRACTNFEFFNISEDMEKASPNSDHSGQPLTRLARGPFLTLKRAEHDFLRLLRNILGDNARHSSHHSVYPLSKVRLEDMEFPSAVRLSAADVVANKLDLDEVQIGADAVELEVSTGVSESSTSRSQKQTCFDVLSEAFAILRRTTILPVITSVINTANEGQRQIKEADVIEHCLRLGPEYCRIDLSLRESALTYWLTNRGKTQLIGSHASPQRPRLGWQNPQLVSVYEKACRVGIEFVDFSIPAENHRDAFDALSVPRRLRGLYDNGKKNISAQCSGKHGRSSMCFNQSLTTVAAPHSSSRSSDLITAKQRNEALFAGLVYEPLHFFIYGANVGFSLSPAMHNAAYKACGMSHTYGTRSASNLDDFTTLVREDDFGGAAIVQPFKTTALLLMDQLSPQAKAIGAVNTVIPIRNGETLKFEHSSSSIVPGRNRAGPVKALHGDNTDWIGIRACIRRSLSPANTVRPHSTGLVCGAGGMARAGIFALITLGVKNIFVCNRTTTHAQALAEHYNRLIRSNALADASLVDTHDVHIEALSSFDSAWPSDTRHPTIVVSCIPTQTTDGVATNFTLPTGWLASPTGGVVLELAYMPVVTPVVLQVRELARKGWILMDGLDVLPEQAFAQFELFTGRRAPRKLMREEVFQHYNEDNVPLQGALNTDSPTHS